MKLLKIICISLILLSIMVFGSVMPTPAQSTLTPIQTPTTTPTETPTGTPTQSPTNTPIPAVEAAAPESEPTNMLGPEQPKEDTTYGPPVPRQMMQQQQQQGQQGDVESAFSDGGPENIFDTKPNDTTGSVIKIIVTVIALTFTGIIWWLAMKTNREIVAGERSETKTIDETSLPK